MTGFRSDIQSMRSVARDMRQEGVRPVLSRLIRQGGYRLYVETRRLLQQSVPFALVGAAAAGVVALLSGVSYGLWLIYVGILAALGAIVPHWRARGGHFSAPGGHAADAAVHDHMTEQGSNPRVFPRGGRMLMTAVLLIGAGVLVRMLTW